MPVDIELRVRPRCRHCGSNFIIPDPDGKPHCYMCGRSYYNYREYGRLGGLQTFLLYGSSYMSEIGKRGGRPKHKTLRQLSVPEAQYQLKGGNRLPNRLSKLKELWRNNGGGAR